MNLRVLEGRIRFIKFVMKKKRNTLGGDRTHDHKIKSLALYHLSYGGISVDTPTRDRTGDLLRVKQTS